MLLVEGATQAERSLGANVDGANICYFLVSVVVWIHLSIVSVMRRLDIREANVGMLSKWECLVSVMRGRNKRRQLSQ